MTESNELLTDEQKYRRKESRETNNQLFVDSEEHSEKDKTNVSIVWIHCFACGFRSACE